MRSKFLLMFAAIFAVTSLSVLPACDMGEDDKGPGFDQSQWLSDDQLGSQSTTLTFSISESVSLQAQTDVVKKADLAATKFSQKTGKPLFTYEIVKPSNNKPRTVTSLDGTRTATVTSTEADAGTNLLAINADGTAGLAFAADFPIKVMYTVLDPIGEYVYLALDTGWWGNNGDGIDYAQYISLTNCGLLRVKVADNSYECAAEGKLIQNVDDNYMKAVSGNQKPIQFDDAGNLYFIATPFERICEQSTWDMWIPDDSQEGGHNETVTDEWCWINQSSWNGQVFSIPATNTAGVQTFGEIATITQDTDNAEFFVVLSTGEVVYQVRDTTDWSTSLSMYQGTSTINLTSAGGETWGVDFFTGDTANGVMWGSWATEGVRFARPNPTTAGVQWSTLKTNLFGQVNNGAGSTPNRIMVGDDGRLYGVFTSWYNTIDKDGNWTWGNKLSVFQVLPFDGIPKVELDLGDTDWWQWMGTTPFQVSKGYLYYKESDFVTGLGDRDIINWVRLSDRTTGSLLAETGDRYSLNSWKLSGDTLYFSGTDDSTTTVVTGEIDITAMRAALAIDETAASTGFMTITEMASAIGATSSVQDIEVLTPKAAAVDGGAAPTATFHTSSDNLYSASIDFSKYMNKSTVEAGLTLKAGSTNVEYFPVWIYKSLHMIPDRDGELGNATTTALDVATTYDVALASTGIIDIFSWVFAGDSVQLETRPGSGWYASDTGGSTDPSVTNGNIGKYAGPETEWTSEAWIMETPLPASGNFRVEFSGKNIGWGGPTVMIFDKSCADGTTNAVCTWSNGWEATFASLGLGNWSNLTIEETTNGWKEWHDGETPEVFNGTWKRYRWDFYGSDAKFYYCNTACDTETYWIEVANVASTAVKTRVTTDLRLAFRSWDKVALDSIVVSELTAADTLGTTTFTIDFTDATSDGDLTTKDFGTTADVLDVDDYGFDTNVQSWYNF